MSSQAKPSINHIVAVSLLLALAPFSVCHSSGATPRAAPVPDAQKAICDPIDRELARRRLRLSSAYERGTLKFITDHAGRWRVQPPSKGREILLDMLRLDKQPTSNLRSLLQQKAFVDAKIREGKFTYSTASVRLPGMKGKYNAARIGLPTTSLAGKITEYKYVVARNELDLSKMHPFYFLRSYYKSLVIDGYLYLINDAGNVVSPYFELHDGGMLEKPVKWIVLPECQIAIKNL